MANKINSTLLSQYLNDDTSGLDYCIKSAMLDIVTWIPAEVMGQSESVNGIPYYDVRPLLYDVTNDNKSEVNATIYTVPATFVGNKNAYIKNAYKKGDKVKVDVCARDISLIKKTWQAGNPQNSGMFSFAGSVINGYLTVTEPSNYIDFTQDDIIFIKALKKFIVDASDETDIQSLLVKLGKGAQFGVLLENVIGVVNVAVQVNTATGTGTGTGTAKFTGLGSKTVTASG